ncbi:ABC transporter permease [Shouchella lonarensis]|uniref:Putative ABC transport system permease protein n=1 Tax=Shouchella lonarensis TaxID=1464122 RepID=A0A1G6K515_9BACI|nr:ABC transporter permease [Shouchella lonarensis]SDC26047.1 putative ABC transport system permease protein [Shouchella lonarensis]
MNIIENIKMAFQSIQAQKVRSLLTMLGIIIGIAATMVVVAIGEGARAQLQEELIGTENVREIRINDMKLWDDQANSTKFMMMGYRAFTDENFEKLAELPNVEAVVPMMQKEIELKKGEKGEENEEDSELESVMVTGVNRDYFDVYNLEIADGQTFQDADYLIGTRKAIVSPQLAEQIFPSESPVGKKVQLGTDRVEIIGVLEPPESVIQKEGMMQSLFVTQALWKNISSMWGFEEISNVLISSDSVENVESAAKEAVKLLHQENEMTDVYEVVDKESEVKANSSIDSTMTTIVGGVAAISLIVGGIGVMNIMLVSVTERTREIGIRKSMGATRGQVLFQFLVESIVLTIVGGISGVLLGGILLPIVEPFLNGAEVKLSLPVIGIATGFSAFVGILFGILPAHKAANLDPVEALRHE